MVVGCCWDDVGMFAGVLSERCRLVAGMFYRCVLSECFVGVLIGQQGPQAVGAGPGYCLSRPTHH